MTWNATRWCIARSTTRCRRKWVDDMIEGSAPTRLLVINWDYFFPNPLLRAPSFWPRELLAYGWNHHETRFHVSSMQWSIRAAGFRKVGLEPPRCIETEGFWSRFTIVGPVPVLAGDSNLHAARIRPATVGLPDESWDEVWLYGAHHDCGYQAEDRPLLLSRENWMIAHHDAGTRLYVRYPAWRIDPDTGGIYDTEEAPRVPVDRSLDDGEAVPLEFGAVYVCRSGAWVPPWCDDQFEQFLGLAPNEPSWIDDLIERDRKWADEPRTDRSPDRSVTT